MLDAWTINVSAPLWSVAPVSSLVRFHTSVRSLFAPPVFSVVTFIVNPSIEEFRIVMFRTSKGPPTTFQNSLM